MTKLVEVSLDGGQTFVLTHEVVIRVWDMLGPKEGPEFVVQVTADSATIQDDPYGDSRVVLFKDM